jgi:hypothetical protein
MVNFNLEIHFSIFLNRTNLGSEVDIADLTWEQKEQVLRALFIRMNTKKSNLPDSSMNE